MDESVPEHARSPSHRNLKDNFITMTKIENVAVNDDNFSSEEEIVAAFKKEENPFGTIGASESLGDESQDVVYKKVLSRTSPMKQINIEEFQEILA